MTPPTRSMLRLDLKDLTSEPPTPVFNRVACAAMAAGVLLVIYVLINGLSASSNEAPTDQAPADLSATETPASQMLATQTHAAETEVMMLAGVGFPPTPTLAVQHPIANDTATATNSATANSPLETVALKNAPAANDTDTWTTITVKPRDTLSLIFQQHGLNVRDAYLAAELEDAAVLRKIQPGAEIRLAANESGGLAALHYRLDAFTTVRVLREQQQLRADRITRTPEIRLRGARATIHTNLLDAALGVSMDFPTVFALAQLFGWQVDFNREIRSGDQFAVLFEELYLDGEKVGNGDILAAELMVSNRRLRAIRHVDAHGNRTYYAPNGDGTQRSFLRSPLKFGRVTSGFSHKRFHPIFKQWRAHRGVDYAAARGTPVRSTGDGVITIAKRDGGYGKTIVIRHAGKYTTLYAHLNGFAAQMKSGKRVKQGDVIGYVGSSGWATGAHLHYEFRVNGIHRNPLTVKLPKSDPIARQYLAEFLVEADAWGMRLAKVGTSIRAIDIAQMDAAPGNAANMDAVQPSSAH